MENLEANLELPVKEHIQKATRKKKNLLCYKQKQNIDRNTSQYCLQVERIRERVKGLSVSEIKDKFKLKEVFLSNSERSELVDIYQSLKSKSKNRSHFEKLRKQFKLITNKSN